MSYLHRQALKEPEFVAMLPFLVVKHVFGLGNIASDTANRGYHCLGMKSGLETTPTSIFVP